MTALFVVLKESRSVTCIIPLLQRLACRFQEHDFEICALAFSKDERLLATVGNERSVKCQTAQQCIAQHGALLAAAASWLCTLLPAAVEMQPAQALCCK
jgi:hypothetical protein